MDRLKVALIRLGREVFRYLRARGLDRKIAAALYLLLDALQPGSNSPGRQKRQRAEEDAAKRAAALRTLGLDA